MPKKQAKRKSNSILEGFAFETMHGAHLVERLLDAAMVSATPLHKKYPELQNKIDKAFEAIWELYQEAGRIWSNNTKVTKRLKRKKT